VAVVTSSIEDTAFGAEPFPAEPPLLDWPCLIRTVLEDPRRLTLVFQPIVSIAEGTVVGYEALSRFPRLRSGEECWPKVGPDRWFAAADAIGCGPDLEAIVVRRCLALKDTLPPDTFLTVNVSPHLLTDPRISGPLLAAGNLAPLILELTEHQQVADLVPLIRLRDELAERGGLLALDDAGSGYSGLQQITRMRPNLIKLDRALVADADNDEVKLALAGLLGEFASRIDAWLLAEGVETWAELEAFARLGVPLAQGFLLGRPGQPWATLSASASARLRAAGGKAELTDTVGALVERVPMEGGGPVPPGSFGLLLDSWGRPQALLVPRSPPGGPRSGSASHRVVPVSMKVTAGESVVELAQRLVARPVHCRFDPVACVDERGRAAGIVRVERLLVRLAELQRS
jgi:EAL domain-containing protein (putative c-di-GMP-specific phosphodiesterase class I)